jgi:hypothetical protein
MRQLKMYDMVYKKGVFVYSGIQFTIQDIATYCYILYCKLE